MLKVVKWTLVFAALCGIGWLGYHWYDTEKHGVGNLWRHVPADAVFCMTTADPVTTWRELAGSDAWTHLRGNEWFAGLTSSVNTLDSIVHGNDLLFDLVGSRPLAVSVHMTAFKKYDFLFVADLQHAPGIAFLDDFLTNFRAGGISIQKERFGGEDLVTVRDVVGNSNLYLSIPGNYLLASYNRKLLIASIRAGQDSVRTKGDAYARVSRKPGDEGLASLFVNYDMLPAFVRCYSNEGAEGIAQLAASLRATTLDVTMENDLMKAAGETVINDSVESYVKALAAAGGGPSEFLEIAPRRTAFALSMGFESFQDFFAAFERNIQQDVSGYQAHRDELMQVTRYLGVDLHEHFIRWIGDEIAVLELQSSGQGLDNETAIILKAKNIEEARDGLGHIEKMVRRKTPVRFKAVEYRGFSINYLSMKGLFRILLGKFFARYDKPYFTILNNFVIFSGHPQTLESIIDDYLDRNTLIHDDEFLEFSREFSPESAVFVYLNTPVLFNTMKKLADQGTRSAMDANREYITSFRQVGFQLVPESGGFRTILAQKFVAPPASGALVTATSPGENTPDDADAEVPATPVIQAERDPMELPYIYVQDLSARSYIGYFPDSAVHFEVGLKNGFKDGAFTEYYQHGGIKMDGHFRDDQRDGVWRLYDENGELLLRRTYQDNEIRKERSNQ